jgi:hypothetical protein
VGKKPVSAARHKSSRNWAFKLALPDCRRDVKGKSLYQ